MALTRDQELKLAQNRIVAGQAGSEDVKNLDYAKDYVTPEAGVHFNAPATTNAGGKTVEEMIAGGSSGGGSSLTPVSTAYNGDDNKEAESYESIRERTMEEMQSQIDSINSSYNAVMDQEKIYGTDRLGRTRSGSARGGLIGSSFGNMRQDKTEAYNTQQERAIEADRSAALSTVYSNLDKRVDERYDAEVSRARGATDDYNAWLEKTKIDTRNDLAMFAANGGDSIQDPDDYKEFAELAGFGYDEESGTSLMMDAFMNGNKPVEERIDYKYHQLDDGTFMRTGGGTELNVGNYSKPDESADWKMQDINGMLQWVKTDKGGVIYDFGGAVDSPEATGGGGDGTASTGGINISDDQKNSLYNKGFSSDLLNSTLEAISGGIGDFSTYDLLVASGASEEKAKSMAAALGDVLDNITPEERMDLDAPSGEETYEDRLAKFKQIYPSQESMKQLLITQIPDGLTQNEITEKTEAINAKSKEELQAAGMTFFRANEFNKL